MKPKLDTTLKTQLKKKKTTSNTIQDSGEKLGLKRRLTFIPYQTRQQTEKDKLAKGPKGKRHKNKDRQ